MTELEKSEICNKLASAFMEFAAMLSTPDVVTQVEEDQRQYYTVKELAEVGNYHPRENPLWRIWDRCHQGWQSLSRAKRGPTKLLRLPFRRV